LCLEVYIILCIPCYSSILCPIIGMRIMKKRGSKKKVESETHGPSHMGLIHSRQLCKIGDLKSGESNSVVIADEDVPSLQLKGMNLRRASFIRVRCKAAKIQESRFIHCIFEDCYFRETNFAGVDFTGSYFKDCNLYKATLQGCRLWYVRFHRCSLDYEAILRCIPAETSIAVPLLRSLRSNALEMGEKEIADRILLREIEKEKEEFKNRLLGVSDYYRSRFGTLERLESGLRLAGSVLSGWLWGYGLKLRNLFLVAFVLIFGFSLWLYASGSFEIAGKEGEPVKLDLARSLYISVVTFTSLGCNTHSPVSVSAHIALALESFLGVLFLGFFAAAIYRRFSR
jgi:hypothetical protein